MKRCAAAVPGACLPAIAGAHGVGEDAAGWTWDARVVLPLLASLAWYLAGLWRVHARAAHLDWRLPGCFLLGWAVLAAALVSPLHAAGGRSFAAHMLEHELLMLVAAPLLAASRPVGIALWALPEAWRLRLARATRGGWQRAWDVFSAPLVATALQAVALWAWHAPRAFDLALANRGWHVAQHASFLATALLFWWAVLRVHRTRVGVAVACLFLTSLVGGALGALMALSASPWYAGYARAGLDGFGLDPVRDQQLAGLLMWVPGGLVHAVAGVVLLGRRLSAAAVAALALLACMPAARAETLYVSDEQANVVHVIEAPSWKVARRIDVGRRPRGLHADVASARLYVAASDDDRIDVVDLPSNAVVAHVAAGADPERFALSPDRRTLYVANEDDAVVSFVDVASGRRLAEVPVGAEPEGIAASPDGRWVVCTSETASLVHFIDAATHAVVADVPVGTRPRDAVFSRDGRWLWVSSEARATVAVFDMRDRRIVRTIDFDRDPRATASVQAVGIALSDDGARAWVALGRGDRLAEVDARSGAILRYYPVGHRSWGVALSPDGTRAYATGGLSGDLTVIDLREHRVLATIALGGRPWGVAVAP